MSVYPIHYIVPGAQAPLIYSDIEFAYAFRLFPIIDGLPHHDDQTVCFGLECKKVTPGRAYIFWFGKEKHELIGWKCLGGDESNSSYTY